MKRLIIYLLLLFLSFESFSQKWADDIQSKAEFDKFSGLPLSDKYGNVSAIKLVYDIEAKKVYYINSHYFKYHHEFCKQELSYDVELSTYNKYNYSDNPKRRYLLANINYFSTLKLFALEISPVDLMPHVDIFMLRDLVSETTFIGDSITFLLNSTRLQNEKQLFDGKIQTLSPSDIYKNLDFQAISKYKRCGNLHFIKDLKAEESSINPTDIIVINETPLYLPKVSGIITTEFQTPLSHLSILGQNRKIPIAAVINAYSDSSLLKLNGKKLCLEVFNNTYTIEQVNKLDDVTENHKPIKLKFDLTVDSLADIEFLDRKSYKYAGNKASNFALLYNLSKKNKFKVPENAFVIPFYFYNAHIINSGTQELIDNFLADKEKYTDADALKSDLKRIRKQIKSSQIDSSLISLVNKKALRNTAYTRLRFRSSTNAEDAKGFSGAGLYTSKTGILDDDKKSYEKAIKKVWASLWSYEAFSEREYYNIDHKQVYMGILVHRSFPNEDVNGVAITKNLYRMNSFGFVVNAQLGNENVVNPTNGVVSDQFICYPNADKNIYENKNTVDIITQSSLNNDELVMSESEIQNLANQLELIKKHFFNRSFSSKTFLDYGLDIEFKLDGQSRDLYIKQVRIYND